MASDSQVITRVGLLLALISVLVSIACWQLLGVTQDGHSHSKSNLVGELKKEIRQNVQKFHGEMGFAEWTVYFVYGSVLAFAVVLGILFFLLTIKIKNQPKFQNVTTQTDCISDILQDLIQAIEISEANAEANSNQSRTSLPDEIDADDEFQSLSYQDENDCASVQTKEPSVVNCGEVGDSTEEFDSSTGFFYSNDGSPKPQHSTFYARTTMQINFVKTRFPPSELAILSSAIVITTPGAYDYNEYFYQHYYMEVEDVCEEDMKLDVKLLAL